MLIYKDNRFLNIFFSLLVSFICESYITIIENSFLFFNFSFHDFIRLFSMKEFILMTIIFLIIFYILFDKNRRFKFINFIYCYRWPLSFLIIILAIIFQIHGSSINEVNYFNVSHKILLGVSRVVRTDEYAVNTPFAFSQYLNNFSYFSDIVRGSLTDMFIVYGQPVLDIGMIFRPFLMGYLFLNQGQGLSFFWITRLIFLFLVSFEFGMLLTNKNKTLSIAYSFLITLSPIIQWWFAINGLVEQIIFGQLSILLINWYMTITDYKKRLIIALGLMISIGTFLLVFYPSWQIPFAYVFFMLALWIFFKRWHNFSFNKKDLLICISVLLIFSIVMIHIFSNSMETIKLVLNTAYPGSEVFNGKGLINAFTYYIPSIFYPITQKHLILNVCEYGSFVDLFPIPIILAYIILFNQKTKDKLLIFLLILYTILVIFYLIPLPDFIINLTLRSHIRSHRFIPIFTFVGVLILIRSLCSLKKISNKKILSLSLILSVLMVFLSTFEFSAYYSIFMIVILIVFYFIMFFLSLFAFSKRNQKIFLIAIISLSCLTGALVNPIDYGTDVVFNSDFADYVEKIVENDPNGIWITQSMLPDTLLPLGAKTINSDQTYPDFNKWEKLDVDKKYHYIYNRYAHIIINLQNNNSTSFEYVKDNHFNVNMNVNDLEKLNVSYIATKINLENLSNNNIIFEKLYQDGDYKIYHVKIMRFLNN